jgi:DNA primase
MSLFNEIKSQVAVRDVVSEYVILRPMGTYLKGRCPFHSERTASFSVSPHKNIFYCFGCHASGDVISFIAKIENCSQFEAAQSLIERYGLQITEKTRSELKVSVQADHEKKRYFDLIEIVAEWCSQQLHASMHAREYVINRGIDKNILDVFMLGYFPAGSNSVRALIKWVVSKRFLADDLVRAHVLLEGKSGLYSPFEERIIFPIRDHLGRYCGFGGRVFVSSDERAKYYNSRENTYFNKGSLVFGLSNAKKSMQKEGEVFLVEGYTDCIAMVQHGYQNTVATLGTSCTLEHLKILSRYCHMVYIVYDGDRAGQDAVMRLTQLCWQVNLELRVVTLPEGEDPASVLRNKKDLASAIAHACDIYTFVIKRQSIATFNQGFTQKVSAARTIIEMIVTLEDPLKRSVLMQETSRAFDIPYEVIEREAGVISRPGGAIRKSLESGLIQDELVMPTVPAVEKRFLAAILNNNLVFTQEQEYLIEYLSDSVNIIIRSLLDLRSQKTSAVEYDEWFASLDTLNQAFAHRVLIEYGNDQSESYAELIEHLERHCWKEMIATMKYDLALAQKSADVQKMSEIIERFQERKKKMMRVDNDK